jgi:hypothetical protein
VGVELRPLLPAGEPTDLTAEIERRQAAWRDDPGPDGEAGTEDDLVTMPADDAELLLEDAGRWQGRARVLEAAGRFRKP